MNEEELWREWPRDPRILVSNMGYVVSCKRGEPYPLKVWHDRGGYQRVHAGAGSRPLRLVHRMVAETWIPNPNPDYYTQVNHIDGNKDNNRADNLEWVTPSQNIRHAFRTGLKKTTPVRIVETGEVFDSIHECARRIGGSSQNIWQCLNGMRSTHLGYHFERVED